MNIERDLLVEVVKNSETKKECLDKLKLHNTSNSSYRTLNYYLRIYEIDHDHLKNYNKQSVEKLKINNSIPLKDILEGKYPLFPTSKLRIKLINNNVLDNKCNICELREWNAKPIPLDLDHINGDSTDHRLENLRLLCRNCHAQTDTFCGKNKKYKPSKLSNTKIINKIKNDKKIQRVLQSDIDFSKWGWSKEAAVLLEILPQKVNRWFMRWMPEFYNTNCFKRKVAAGEEIESP